MTKRELRAALPITPLGVNINRLPIALTLTGQTLADVFHATKIQISTLSEISTGKRTPTREQRIALAQHFGTTPSVLFPEVRSEVA